MGFTPIPSCSIVTVSTNREIYATNEDSKFNNVPERFDENATIKWTPVWSLTESRYKYLPTELLYFGAPAGDDQGHSYCHCCSNGNSAGNTREEALLQGLFELVERDAVAVWWYNRLSRPGVALASLNDYWILDLVGHYQSLGREVWALDITSDLGIPSFVALSRKRQGAQERILLGFGCHLDRILLSSGPLQSSIRCIRCRMKTLSHRCG